MSGASARLRLGRHGHQSRRQNEKHQENLAVYHVYPFAFSGLLSVRQPESSCATQRPPLPKQMVDREIKRPMAWPFQAIFENPEWPFANSLPSCIANIAARLYR